MTELVPSPSRILIVKLTSVGDILHTFPAVGAIARAFPQAALSWAVDARMADLVRANPHVDDLIVVGRDDGHSAVPRWRDYARAARQARAARFDLAVDMQGLLKSAIITYYSAAPRRLGFGWCRVGGRWALNMRLPGPPPARHAVDVYCEFARYLGAEPDPAQFDLAPRQADGAAAEALLAKAFGAVPDMPVVLLPASAWPSKQWPPDRFAALARALAAEGAHVAVLASAGARDLAADIARRAGGGVASLAGQTTLGQLISLLERCRLAVGGDTGPTHIAAALGVPTLALYGPTSPEVTGPRGPAVRVVRHQVPCAPCRERACDHWECMLDLSPDEVVAAARQLLSASSAVPAGGAA
ncbi:MAG: lipopolysaccharide heptosyltransferase II [Armatimonadota bacterium]